MWAGPTRTLSLLLLGVVACAPAPIAPAPDTAFAVVTCNVRYGTADDGPDAWPLRREMLTERLMAQNPAILGVQEALDFQLDYLQQRLPQHQRIGQGRDGGNRGEHAALFVDQRRFEIVASGDFWLSPTPSVVGSVGWDAALTRICTWVQLRERASGRPLRVYNAHFDHRGEKARLHAAELIAARLPEAGCPCLVLGDFNAGEGSPPLQALRAAGLRDTFRDMQPDAKQVGTFHAFRGGTDGDKIDYVLASPGLVTCAATILSQAGPTGRWISDHHPVLAILRLQP